MKIIQRMWVVIIFSMISIWLCAQPIHRRSKEMKVRKPNIIIILADDLGYGDLPAFGGDTKARTPNIDRLIAGGLKFTNFHTNGVVCSPTRASLMTGLYPREAGIESVVTARHHRHTGMSPEYYTLAEFLKENGYTTALYGKWHLGYQPEFGPIAQGFDHFRGFVSGNVDYFNHIDQEGFPDWWKQDRLQPERGYLTELITDHGIDFMENTTDQPFFLYLAHGAPHYPYQGPGDRGYRTTKGEFHVTGNPDNKKQTYREMIESLDHNIGRIMNYLVDQHLLEQTLILFFSDNGATLNAGSNYPFRGGKSSVWEGGHRVPAVFYWKDQIEVNSTDHLVMMMDIFPTIADILGQELDEKLKVSGTSIADLALSASDASPDPEQKRTVFWKWSANSQPGNQEAVRQGQWKLVVMPSGSALYNLENDPGETTDLKSDYPDLVQELSKALGEWEESLQDVKTTVAKIK